MRVLGIETSCDETAAAVVEDGKHVLSKVVGVQFDVHSPYGGVVPELAARSHVERIHPIVQEAVLQAGGWGRLEGVAVTRGPGLLVALLVGLQAAKGIALARKLPLVGVHHLAGHVASIYLQDATLPPAGLGGGQPPDFPFVALVVSGGHTHLYRADEGDQNQAIRYQLLGATRDDAAGEAYDKVASLLGLGFPGGPRIDSLARNSEGEQEEEHSVPRFPRPMLGDPTLDFSFSGLKTAVLVYLQSIGVYDDDPLKSPLDRTGEMSSELLEKICREFQNAVIDVLMQKAFRAVCQEGVRDLVVVGGVAANEGLRNALIEMGGLEDVRVHVPAIEYCTDNAVMIAAAGTPLLRQKRIFLEDTLSMEADPGWELDS